VSQTITVLTVADLHRGKVLYNLLRTAIARHRPDILALVGDFLDATGEQEGKLTTEECVRFLGRLPCPEIIFVRGNHEDSAWFAFADEWKTSGRELHLLDGQTFTYGPLIIVGFPCLMTRGMASLTPFLPTPTGGSPSWFALSGQPHVPSG
jgi:metallophosphoesterase superfamily enzyme